MRPPSAPSRMAAPSIKDMKTMIITDDRPLSVTDHEHAVFKYTQEHGLLNSENLPFDEMPFR
jgi:hypothetical protein